MSEFGPQHVAEDGTSSGAAQPEAAAGAVRSAANSDTEHRHRGSIAAAQASATVEPQSAARSMDAPDSPVKAVVASESVVAPDSPVKAALTELERLGERPVAEHPDIYGRAHAQLQSALSAIDDA